jgi:indole-3-glycerol phosphate synthase
MAPSRAGVRGRRQLAVARRRQEAYRAAEELPKDKYPKVNRNARVSFSILDRIVEARRIAVQTLRPRAPDLQVAAASAPRAPDFAAALRAGPTVALIAEVKRRSPSAGELSSGVDGPEGAAEVALRYEAAGAAAISVLTEPDHFGGSLSDLETVRSAVSCPLLRKDFVVDPLQIVEAKAAGAAAVLLIARILDDAELRDYAAVAGELGLAALVEVHDESELERALAAGASIIGINNRNLDTFETDLETTARLASQCPGDRLLVSESGIRAPADVARVAAAGAAAVLVGESLMRAADPASLSRALASVPRP